MRRLIRSSSQEAEVDITPLLDVVFILLIFFIVTATFLQETGIELVVPQDNAQENETRPPPTLILSVRTDGFVEIDGGRLIDPRSVAPVIEEFKAREPRGVVMVSAAPDAKAEVSVTVIDQARQAGVDPAIAIQRSSAR
ncbi:MAG: biopolymer transporter ExbD [Polycyclovorans sp.]|jgi:biopolymer transport protein ExbD|nr:biopolymer transporter ExbD [Polycyclovorans sp.]MBU0790692.1 biopolymer transporter ExbD [Gammaproteobacteria bacterium]MDP1542872.1 biopolymer transporter ExbD [Polycyclovorans sp.]MEC8848401.1 biopolymer transporter ExbD [Pseudomonadota bacterium]|tara:strand:- start:14726 stop:15142 length:417 start_codon:yes stop_codon:yes gene_type:complete